MKTPPRIRTERQESSAAREVTARVSRTMSIFRTVTRALAPLAMRSATRPMAVIPELIHEKEKREAARVDFFGQEQDIDSR